MSVMRSAGEQDAFARRSGFARRASVFDHLDAVDLAFDGAGAVGQGEPCSEGGPVLAQAGGEAAQIADGAALGLAGPGAQVVSGSVAEHVSEQPALDEGRRTTAATS